ncbi:sensor histidine kinase [Desulforhabdus amnigena]|uniref:histidine kinase n=1 Tax=Desulforhabdus amnigena TaxID=40218 RepID=A0A9W6FSB4_9BACT|nr:HAMP domain-containing sensor histidine kinase [Desulforhabdus amnigena]NLJ29306.1 HAMP domain-containing histidine kinase [Deltaproteobacteria bacterium]GLI34427.1 two-component sensor histidine kinase [Desulforhabdus amnigena]
MNSNSLLFHRFFGWAKPRLQLASRSIMRSIKGQIFIVFAATFLSVCILSVLHFWSLSTVKERLLLGERYDDLLNNILELRRFEKNYLFYGDLGSLREGLDYLKIIDALTRELSEDIMKVSDQRAFQSFQKTLSTYDHSLRTFEENDKTIAHREEIRLQGKTLVDSAEHLLKTKRERIHKAIMQTSVVPFAFLGVFVTLMLFIIKLISLGLLRPLKVMQGTIQRMARGDYSPIIYEGLHTDEMSGVIGAFNRMAQELEVNQEDLLQARKIAALGTFTAGIAHELNNPINNIYLTAETLMDDYAETMETEGKEMISDILVQAERAGEIVRNLLDFSRTERPAFSSLSPMEIIQSTVNLLRNQIMLAGIKLETRIPDQPAPVNGNLRNLQQIFMNLLLNAIQAMPNGGKITVSAVDDLPDFVRIDVQDEGEGIEPETLEHIFEPFFTTKEVGRGTGLGLAVAYSIVKRHGGRIEVKSEPGRGTVFSVFLPKSSPGQPPMEKRMEEMKENAGTHCNC